MTSTVARLTEPADLAAVVPELVGFPPHESLVVLSLHEPRGRLGMTMRFDLAAGDLLVDEAARRLQRDGASRAAVVVFTARPGDLPHRRLVLDLLARLQADGLRITEALLVRGGTWWSYTCDDDCCPSTGSPVAPTTGGPTGLVAAERVLAGKVLWGSREELVRSLQPVLPLGEGPRLAQLEEVARDLLDEVVEDRPAAVRVEVARLLDGLGRGGVPDAHESARIAVALRLAEVRDAVTASIPDGAAEVAALMTAVLRWTPHAEGGRVLQVLGTAAYADGDGALARVALEAAVEVDGPGCFAQTLLDALDAQVPPSALRRSLVRTARPLAS